MNVLIVPNSFGLLAPVCGAQKWLEEISKSLSQMGVSLNIIIDEDYNAGSINGVEVTSFKEQKAGPFKLNLFRLVNLDYLRQLYACLRGHKPDTIIFTHPTDALAIFIMGRIIDSNVKVIYGAQNVESKFIMEMPQYPHWLKRLLSIYISLCEVLTIKVFNIPTTTVSNRDTTLLRERYRAGSSQISTSGTGKVRTKDGRAYSEVQEGRFSSPKPVRIVFLGSAGHTPNMEAAQLIIDTISKEFLSYGDRVEFVLAGSGMDMPPTSNVRSVGFVDDVMEFLEGMNIAIVPLLHGEGIKVKVVDFLISGLPIVTTKKGAEGLDLTDGKEAFITETVNADFIAKLKVLVDDEQWRREMGANSHAYARRLKYWDEISRDIIRLESSELRTELDELMRANRQKDIK